MPTKKAFDFVKIDEVPPKPRKKGIVEMRGPYYTPVSLGYLENILDTWGEYVDGVKFAGGSMRLMKLVDVKKFLKICHDHDCYVSTGGFVERIIVQGQKAVDRYFEECKTLGFDMVEISSGLAPIPIEDKVAMVKEVKRLGMMPKPEITMMEGAGAGTHIANYKPKMRPFSEFVREAKLQLKAGAHILMFESEGVYEDMAPKDWKLNIVKSVIKEFGLNAWMFEAADPVVFKWFLQNYGSDTNVFIDHSQVTEYTAWRCKLWGDHRIWQGKKVSYK